MILQHAQYSSNIHATSIKSSRVNQFML